MLQFLKDRDTKPMVEEKQILDGIHIILENGWIIQTNELLQYFDLLSLGKKNPGASEENLKFLEFIYLLGRLFDINMVKLQQYFQV